MPNIHDMFPSKYVKSGELNQPVVLTIKEVKYERVYNPRIGDTDVWVVYFEGAKKGLILNKVNAFAIADILGSPDTEEWVGGEIELYPTSVRVAGEKKAAIRIREPGEK
ncbi:MAG: hypothetical protein U9R58_06050, partial [Chloroflexota bacterium]|nr:hypothetical protein [Chloroflexota bacterium]